MSELRVAARDYLALRRSFGFKLTEAGRLLGQFIDHLESQGATTVTTALALEWATLPSGADPWWWCERLSVVRGFARYLSAFDASAEIPPTGLIHSTVPRATPYVYSEADVLALMATAERIPSALRRATYQTLIGLLAVTGMRVGEAIALDQEDVDLDDGLIVIRQAKFDKSRLLVLHPSTTSALDRYRRVRRRLYPRPATPAFFVSTVGTRLHYSNVCSLFRRLASAAGLPRPDQAGRARIHDFRHSFAINTVVGWYAAGMEVGPRLAVLSTHLGHAKPSDTYWYLTATPALLEQAARRLEDSRP